MTDKKKVLILADINSIHTQKWVKSLMCDFDIFLCSIDPIQNRTTMIEDLLSKVQFYSSEKRLSNTSNKLLFLKFYLQLIRIKTAFKPNIIHSHYATSYGLLGRLLFFKRFYISVWGSDIFEFPLKSTLHKIIIKFILKGASKLFSTSSIMASEIKKYTNQDVAVIPFGIDTKKFKPFSIERQKTSFTIGTIKSLEELYGIDRLIEVFEHVFQQIPDATCVIYGSGSKEKDLKQLIKNKKLDNHIFLKGKVANDKVPEILSSFDLFCAFSRSESFGVAVIEASSCSVPVLTSNVGGLPEVVKEGETGYLFDYDPIDISKKIVSLYNNPSLRNELGVNGRKFVLENYDWQKSVDMMKQYYIC